MTRPGQGGWAFGAGLALAGAACLLTVWTTIVRDDGSGAAALMLILAAGVGSFAALFQPAGMARAMVGTAAMQAALGWLTATAPSTANLPGGSTKVLLFSGGFALLWLASAAFFHVAGRRARG